MFPRSSYGIKHGVVLANSVGKIDQDFFENESNDGNIGIALRNESIVPFMIQKGDHIAQGSVYEIRLMDNDRYREEDRIGGVGSSGR